MTPTRILTTDTIFADTVVHLTDPHTGQTNHKLMRLLEEHGFTEGSKHSLSREQFEEFSRAAEESPQKQFPGGNSTNMVITLSKLLGEEAVSATMLGVTGHDQMIEQAFNEAHIELLPKAHATVPETGRSLIMVHPDGERTIVKYPGNVRDILKPELITEELVENHDVILVQGSAWQKFEQDYADRLLTLRWKKGKQLWLALPTDEEFGEKNGQKFQWLAPSANLISGNVNELGRLYGIKPEGKKKIEDSPQLTHLALEKLQQTLAESQVQDRIKPIAFITFGGHGAAIVNKDEIIPIDPPQVAIANTYGAGDTSFAGFAAGYLLGLPHKTSAEIAKSLASEVIQIDDPHLQNPMASLRNSSPSLATAVERKRAAFVNRDRETASEIAEADRYQR